MKTAPIPGNAAWRHREADPVLQRIMPKGLPILFDDDGTEMGKSTQVNGTKRGKNG
jgi:hypothetical protein